MNELNLSQRLELFSQMSRVRINPYIYRNESERMTKYLEIRLDLVRAIRAQIKSQIERVDSDTSS